MTVNTTTALIADIEALREDLRIERWLIVAGSWGSTLALAYAEAYTEHVTGMVLFGITTGRWSEFAWTFRGGLGAFFPEQWQRLLDGLPPEDRSDVVGGYRRLLNSPDGEVRARAARAWCEWESATPEWPPTNTLAKRFEDPRYAVAFARIVTHYVHHNAWLEDGTLLRGADRLRCVSGILVNGRYDFQAPLGNAYALNRAWPGSELMVVDEAGHAGSRAVAAKVRRSIGRLPGR